MTCFWWLDNTVTKIVILCQRPGKLHPKWLIVDHWGETRASCCAVRTYFLCCILFQHWAGYKKNQAGAGEGSAVKSTGYSTKRPRFNSQNPHGSSPIWNASLRGSSTLFWPLQALHSWNAHTCTQTQIIFKKHIFRRNIGQIKKTFCKIPNQAFSWPLTSTGNCNTLPMLINK